VAGTELGSAYISVGLGTNTLGPEIKKVFGGIEGDAGSAGSTAGKSFSGKFSGFMKSAAVPALGVLGGIGLMAKGFGDLAAEAEQNLGAVDSVFKGSAGQIAGYAKDSAKTLGISSSEYNSFAGLIGSQFKNAGVPMDKLAGQTNDLVTKGADLASMFGGTTSDAVGALSSALKGEMDPIEAYGISLSDSAIQGKLAEMGLSGLKGEAAKAAKTQAILALVNDQSADATGNFAKETGTAAGAQQIATAAWADASAKLGEVLLPIMTSVATAVADMSKWISENSGLVTGLAIGIGILAGVIAVWSAVQGILNLVMLASPITWIILGIVALIAAIVLLVMNWDAVVAFLTQIWGGFINWVVQVLDGFVVWWNQVWGGLGNWIKEVWDGFVAWITNVWNGFMGWIQGVLGGFVGWWNGLWAGIGAFISTVWNNIVSWVTGAVGNVWNTIMSVVGTIKAYWSAAWAAVLAKIKEVWEGIKSGVSTGINAVVDFVKGLPGKIMGALSGAGSWLVSVGQNIIQGLIDGARGMIGNAVQAVKDVGGSMLDGIKGFLGIHSPSRVFKTQVGMMIGAGLIAGLSASESGVSAAVNNLVAVPSVPSFTAGSYTPASSFAAGGRGAGVTFTGPVHVRDENELASIISTRQRDAHAAYGF
jgi:phage-related minor tail protein